MKSQFQKIYLGIATIVLLSSIFSCTTVKEYEKNKLTTPKWF